MFVVRGKASYANHVCFPGGDGSGAMTFLDNSRPDFFCALTSLPPDSPALHIVESFRKVDNPYIVVPLAPVDQ